MIIGDLGKWMGKLQGKFPNLMLNVKAKFDVLIWHRFTIRYRDDESYLTFATIKVRKVWLEF